MDKKFFGRVILLPLLTGIVIALVFSAVMNTCIDSILPFNRGTVIAMHDGSGDALDMDEGETANWHLSELNDNALIGTVGDLSLRYNADYSLMNETASVMPASAEWDKPGCLYLKILAKEALKFGDTVTVSVPFYGDRQFEFVEEYTVSGERAALSVAPAYPGSMVIYYRITNGIGLSSQYGVMIYREVA